MKISFVFQTSRVWHINILSSTPKLFSYFLSSSLPCNFSLYTASQKQLTLSVFSLQLSFLKSRISSGAFSVLYYRVCQQDNMSHQLPILLRQLSYHFSRFLQQFYFHFSRLCLPTSHKPMPHTLGLSYSNICAPVYQFPSQLFIAIVMVNNHQPKTHGLK